MPRGVQFPPSKRRLRLRGSRTQSYAYNRTMADTLPRLLKLPRFGSLGKPARKPSASCRRSIQTPVGGKSRTTKWKTAFGSNWPGPIERRRASPRTSTDGNVAIAKFDVVIPPKCKRSLVTMLQDHRAGGGFQPVNRISSPPPASPDCARIRRRGKYRITSGENRRRGYG